MHSRAVIAFRVIFEHQLPICLHVVIDPLSPSAASANSNAKTSLTAVRTIPPAEQGNPPDLRKSILPTNRGAPDAVNNRLYQTRGHHPCAARQAVVRQVRTSMRDKDTELRKRGRFDLPGASSRDDGKRCKKRGLIDSLPARQRSGLPVYVARLPPARLSIFYPGRRSNFRPRPPK